MSAERPTSSMAPEEAEARRVGRLFASVSVSSMCEPASETGEWGRAEIGERLGTVGPRTNDQRPTHDQLQLRPVTYRGFEKLSGAYNDKR